MRRQPDMFSSRSLHLWKLKLKMKLKFDPKVPVWIHTMLDYHLRGFFLTQCFDTIIWLLSLWKCQNSAVSWIKDQDCLYLSRQAVFHLLSRILLISFSTVSVRNYRKAIFLLITHTSSRMYVSFYWCIIYLVNKAICIFVYMVFSTIE